MSKSSISCTFLLIHLFILKCLREVFYTLSLFFQYFSLCYIRGFKLSYSEISTTAPTNIMWSEFFPVWQFYTSLMVKFSIIRHAIIYLDGTFNALWIIERNYVCTPCFHSFFSFILWKGSATAWIISTTDIDYDNRKSVHRFRTKTDLRFISVLFEFV